MSAPPELFRAARGGEASVRLHGESAEATAALFYAARTGDTSRVAYLLQTSSAVATGIGFFVTMLMAAGAQAQLGPDADTFGGSAFPIRSFPADNIFDLSLLHYATS